ncbi:GGDEF domain-containing protein [Candidatus Nomurabacteria bacterium]|nr:GGDEF domain-containing protein [Candidatus Nomurabacteria bacterium]
MEQQPSIETETLKELKRTKEELVLAQEKIKELQYKLEMAEIDGLTGLFKPELLSPTLNKLVEELNIVEDKRKSNKVGFMVIVVDVDNFKDFNNNYGHMVGNKALSALGMRFKKVEKRYGDAVYRFGGDEFTLVLSFESDKPISKDTEKAIFERIKKEASDLLYIEVDDSGKNKKVPITFAMGYTFFSKSEPVKTPEEILALADVNQYKEKEEDVKKDRIEKARKAVEALG